LAEYEEVLKPFKDVSKGEKSTIGRWYHALFNGPGAQAKALTQIALDIGLEVRENGRKKKSRDELRKSLMLETWL
jgi:hypothetical protein